MVKINFNANNVEPDTKPDPLPAGKYLVEITATEMKLTKSKNGSYLEVEFTVLEGDCRGRKTWAYLNLNNPSAEAVKIAEKRLSAICHAVGVMHPQDTVELHNLPLVIMVKCKNRSDTGEIANEISGYAKRESATGQPQQAPVTDNTSPWNR